MIAGLLNKLIRITRTKRTIVYSLLSVFVSLLGSAVKAQEYKQEIGAAVGTSFYMGDANRTQLYLHPEFSGGLLHRYHLNWHWAVKSNLYAGRVSGDTKYANNQFPNNNQATFQRTFVDLGSQIEFSFFPYSNGFSYLNTRPYTSYLFIGAGLTYATGNHSFFNVNVPLGVGFKYKIKDRLNVGVEFSIRKLFGDDFDVTDKNMDWSLDAPFGVKSRWYKNRDWYSLTMLFISWEFGRGCDSCDGP